MSKETKEDKLVKAMYPKAKEAVFELNKLKSNIDTKELEIERWVQDFFKNCLEYTPSAGYSIKPQETKGRSRPDLIVCKNDKPVIVIEVKNMKFDLDKSDFRSGKVQLSEYLHNIGDVRWGILTNGVEWKLYDFSVVKHNGLLVRDFDFITEIDDKILNKKTETIDLSKKVIENQCYDLLNFHENRFKDGHWDELSQEALVFSPELLAKAILSNDVVKHITRQIRGEHDYKACQDLVTERVYELLAKGLDNSIVGWNQTKADEFEKYVKNQKRIAKRTKKVKKESVATGVTPETVQPEQSVLVSAETVVAVDAAEVNKAS